MAKPKKGPITRLRPFEGDPELAKEISKATGLNMIDVMSQALHAGLVAIVENGCSLSLPLKMGVLPPEKPESSYRSPPLTHMIVEEKDSKKGKK